MSKNKNAQLRYNIIDRCLSNFSKKHTIYSILEEVNDALAYNGVECIKLRQLQADLSYMQSEGGFSIELEENLKDGKKRILRYKDKNFSLADHPLNQQDSKQLELTITLLSRYKHRKEFEWLEEFIPRMEESFKLVDSGQDGIISYQENPDLKGREHLGNLFNLIIKKKVVEIKYKPYDRESQIYIVSPYHLKQYNNRWFLFCKSENYNTVSNFPLDRIEEIKELDLPYEENTIRWLDYFDEIIGVSKPVGAIPVKIQLKFSENRINFVLTKPIHGASQKRVSTDPDGRTIQIEVIPNNELYQTLLSFGPDVEVIAPAEIREEMKIKINQMKTIY